MVVVYTDGSKPIGGTGRSGGRGPTGKYDEADVDSTDDSASDAGPPRRPRRTPSRSRVDRGSDQDANIRTSTRRRSLSMMKVQATGLRPDGHYHRDTVLAGQAGADDDDLAAHAHQHGDRVQLQLQRHQRKLRMAGLAAADEDLGPSPEQLQAAAVPPPDPHTPRLSTSLVGPASGDGSATATLGGMAAMKLLAVLEKVRFSRELKQMHLSLDIKVTKTVVKLDGIGCPYLQVHCHDPPTQEDLPCAGLRHSWVPLGGNRFCLVQETFAIQVKFVVQSSRLAVAGYQ